MAYARRSTFRRRGRRGNRTLSTRRIFNNKGAKAQAKQIYALRRAVNRVKAQCQPEVKICRSSIDNRGLALSDTATPGTVKQSAFTLPLPIVGNSDSTRIGNKIKLVNPKLFVGLQYRERITSAAGYYNSTLNTHGIQVRLIAVQAKVPHSSVPTLSDILQRVNFDSQIDSMMMMREPFQIGITSRFNILLDKRMTVSMDNPTKSYRIGVRPKTRSVVWEDGQAHPKGAIYFFVMGGGYDYRRFESGEEFLYDSNVADFTFRMETPYTDA
nr:MAG: capsid protein [ssDNA virus sp.]